MIREAKNKDKKRFDAVARHPLQSWQWGEFRKETGVGVGRLIEVEKKKIVEVYQVTWHRIPKTNFFIGYCPKSAIPSRDVLTKLMEIGIQKGAIFIKFEPNEKHGVSELHKIGEISKEFNFVSGKPLFTKYSFHLDISKPEEELLRQMHQKTRYNMRLAQKKGVKIVEDNTIGGFEEYWRLTEETTKRQGFYSHTKNYHQKMWQKMVLGGNGHLLKAVYKGRVLTTWVVFELNGVLYYPYGASSNEYREVMANNLMMWETIRLGKKLGCKTFDMWGSMGPDPDISDPWYGFHRFKQGYGGELVEFVGSYDLVVRPGLYAVYNQADKLRWLVLKLLAKIKK